MQTNSNTSTLKTYDLEKRTLEFSKEIIHLCKRVSKTRINENLVDQLLRSATSVGANYREANDALGKKDFVMRIKIARKEAKETMYWLELLLESNENQHTTISSLIIEVTELKNILSSIIKKSL